MVALLQVQDLWQVRRGQRVGMVVQHWFGVDMSRAKLEACPHWLMYSDILLQHSEQQRCAPGVLCRVALLAGASARKKVV